MIQDAHVVENSKILRSIWKNTFDKILEIKVSNKRHLKEMKSKIMIEEQKLIDEKHNKEYNEQFIQNKIEVSKARNESNLEKMKQKNILVDQIIEETLSKLKEFANPNNQQYKALLKNLIVESMVKMLEKQCIIQVRQVDSPYISSIIPECEKEFAELMNKETKREYKCKLILDEENTIDNEYGGIKMLSLDKKIILVNDLKSRLLLTKEQCLPKIKSMLFAKESK